VKHTTLKSFQPTPSNLLRDILECPQSGYAIVRECDGVHVDVIRFDERRSHCTYVPKDENVCVCGERECSYYFRGIINYRTLRMLNTPNISYIRYILSLVAITRLDEKVSASLTGRHQYTVLAVLDEVFAWAVSDNWDEMWVKWVK
jgi:hypothetical protein